MGTYQSLERASRSTYKIILLLEEKPLSVARTPVVCRCALRCASHSSILFKQFFSCIRPSRESFFGIRAINGTSRYLVKWIGSYNDCFDVIQSLSREKQLFCAIHGRVFDLDKEGHPFNVYPFPVGMIYPKSLKEQIERIEELYQLKRLGKWDDDLYGTIERWDGKVENVSK